MFQAFPCPSLLFEHLSAHLVAAGQLQVQLVSLHPLLPATVLLLPFLHTHEGVAFPGDQGLDMSAVQALCVFVKLHPDGEIQVVVAERAVGFRLEVITVLSDDLRLSRRGCGEAAERRFRGMAGTALKRLMAEYKQLTLNPPEGIVAGPMNEENFFEWEALIMGPEDTCFEFGVFPAILSFPLDYPLSPPKMRFTCEMFHPNIYPDGRVCISILHAPGDDPMGYESSAERWSPVQSVEKILLSVVSMLAEPNDESGANVDASKMWRDDREQFYKIAKQIVQKSLGL